MDRLLRADALPNRMQGRWVGAEDPSSELTIIGGEIVCFGRTVEYDYKEIIEEDGATTVVLGIDDPDRENSFQRANITGLVITPEGEFHVYNVRFGEQFIRADS